MEAVEDYKPKDKKKKTKDDYKKRRVRKLSEVKYTRNEKNFWPHKVHYYFYVFMLGNGPDFFPFMITFALELSGGLFLIMYIACSFLLAMPMIYMEIFLGRYTQMTNSQMYKMVPIFFGFGVMVLVMNMCYVPLNMVKTSHFFINFMKLLIEPDMFEKCPRGADKSCVNYNAFKNGSINGTFCDFIDYNCSQVKKVKYPTEYIYWKTFNDLQGTDYPTWELLISLIVTWLVVGTILILGMRVIGAMLKSTTIISWVVFAIVFAMALSTKGSGDGLRLLVAIKYNKLDIYKCMVVGFFSIGRLGILLPGGYMTASAYAKFSKRLGTGAETLVLVTTNVSISIIFLAGMFSIAGALGQALKISPDQVMSPFNGLFLALITQFLTHMDCPNSFMSLYLFIYWFIQVIKMAVVIHLIVLNLYDYLPQLSYFPNYVVTSVVGLCGVMSIVGSLQIFVSLAHLLGVNYVVLCLVVHTLLESSCVFYCYGVKRLCDDIHFMTGRKPMRFWLVLWYILPFVSIVSFIVIISKIEDLHHIESSLTQRNLSMNEVYGGLSLLLLTLLVSFTGSFLYVVLGFRNANANLLKPQFFWGPPRRDVRVSRKSFAPRTSIRSQPPRKKKQRFRVRSIKQMHEKDLADGTRRGRIFVDTMYFKNITLSRKKALDVKMTY